MNIPKDMLPGTIHETSKCGSLKIIEYKGCSAVKVRFSDTGFITIAHSGNIRLGLVKDLSVSLAYGVGFFGDGKYLSEIDHKPTKAYRTWRNMLKRCYSTANFETQPTYKCCSVVTDWHNYQNFAAWFELNYRTGMELDKDIKIKGNKVYGPKTCAFVTPQQNKEAALAKRYTFISPEGETVNIYNLTKFCRENGLNEGGMNSVANNKADQHKGWTKSNQLINRQ